MIQQSHLWAQTQNNWNQDIEAISAPSYSLPAFFNIDTIHKQPKCSLTNKCVLKQRALCVCSVTQSCLFCNPMDCRPPGSSVHGIFQARILEWVALSSCKTSSPPRDWTHICSGRQVLYCWASWEAHACTVEFSLHKEREILPFVRS